MVMVTALDPSEERIKGIEAGADDFLTKPINQAELLARTKLLLESRNFMTPFKLKPPSFRIGTRLYNSALKSR